MRSLDPCRPPFPALLKLTLRSAWRAVRSYHIESTRLLHSSRAALVFMMCCLPNHAACMDCRCLLKKRFPLCETDLDGLALGTSRCFADKLCPYAPTPTRRATQEEAELDATMMQSTLAMYKFGDDPTSNWNASRYVLELGVVFFC